MRKSRLYRKQGESRSKYVCARLYADDEGFEELGSINIWIVLQTRKVNRLCNLLLITTTHKTYISIATDNKKKSKN